MAGEGGLSPPHPPLGSHRPSPAVPSPAPAPEQGCLGQTGSQGQGWPLAELPQCPHPAPLGLGTTGLQEPLPPTKPARPRGWGALHWEGPWPHRAGPLQDPGVTIYILCLVHLLPGWGTFHLCAGGELQIPRIWGLVSANLASDRSPPPAGMTRQLGLACRPSAASRAAFGAAKPLQPPAVLSQEAACSILWWDISLVGESSGGGLCHH